MPKYFVVLLILTALVASAAAASWTGFVRTDSGSWSISRESCNVSFIYEQSVEGQISPVDYHGRTLSPYYSSYTDVNLNDVRVGERTAALQGRYSSQGQLKLQSRTNGSVDMVIYKPSGTDLYTIDFYEVWPVNLSYDSSMTYSGREINSRDFLGNNRDYIGASFLYNRELSKDSSLNMSLERMNATVVANDEAIYQADVMATRDTKYRLNSHSTGIASLRHMQIGPGDEILTEGDERFVGVYDLVRSIGMGSRFENVDIADDEIEWLPCCLSGFAGMAPADQKALGSARGIFDCTCFEVP
ncbi:MAG: hypothetical protein A4E45_01973 [Methanosaeta sp. PtaB.Bin039]|nr:MAG: hypothetical protein A4E45_01973 [Methanosaeta sp. PtaB.Bin039]